MPKAKETNENITWEYEFPLPTLNIQSDFRTQPPGSFSRLTGVDGRYRGKLRRFPGWKLSETLDLTGPTVTLGGFGGVSLSPTFTPFAIQLAPNSNKVVQGVLFLGEEAGNTKLYAFMSLDGAAPTREIIHDFGSVGDRPAVLDVTTDSQLIYIVGEDTATDPKGIELLGRYAGTTGLWKTATWPQAFLTENIDTTKFPSIAIRNEGTALGQQLDTGYLETNGEVGVSIRVVFPEQGFVTPLSAPTVFKADPPFNSALGRDYISVFLGLQLSMADVQTLGDVFSSARIQVFRTVEQESFVERGGSVLGGEPVLGQLFLEAEWEIPRQTGSLTGTFDYLSGYNSGANVITSDASVGVLAEGDTLYFTYPIRTNGAAENALESTGAYAFVVFKRKVTNVTGDVITFTDVGPPRDTGSLTVQCKWWGSRSGDGTDSSGAFVEIGTNDCYVGWRPSSEIEAFGGAVEVVRWPSDMPRGLEDVALAIQPKLTPSEFAIFDPTNPPTSQIEEYEGLFVRVTRAGGLNAQTSGRDVLRWENPSLTRKGLVPVFNRRILTDLTDAAIGFVKADPFLVAALNNGLLRIHRSGNRLAVDPIHNRFGAIGVKSMVSVGTNLYVASETGILLVDLLTGRVDALNATQHFFDETENGHWRDDLSSVESAYDSPTASLIFLNPTKFECIIIWLNHGVFTHLIDVPFDNLVTMGSFRTGGLRRAMFYNDVAGKFYEIDANRSQSSRTTVGTVALQTFNGIAGAGTNTTTLFEGAGETFQSDMVGHFIRFPDVGGQEGNGRQYRITSFNSPDNYTFSPAAGGSPLPTTGSRYTIGAIPMKVTAWPLSGDPEQPILDMFRVKTVDSMGVVAVDSSRNPTVAANDLMRYQLFERTAPDSETDSAAVEADNLLSTTTNEANMTSIKRSHSMLAPGFELWTSDMDVSLLGMVVTGRILGTTQDKRT